MGKRLNDIYNKFTSNVRYTHREIDKDIKDLPRTEISSCEDAKKYLELLNFVRTQVDADNDINGENYRKLLKQMLGVGENGVYFSSTRYLLELLQNVDDCDYYNTSSNPCVDIFFDTGNGKIIYTYNEDGFTPRNVHDVTGIASKSKISMEGREYIGEKGIGFKSVFGVVDKVRIQSGWFSFDINEDCFTIPELAYDDFDGYANKTVLTLFMKKDKNVGQIFAELKKKYKAKESIFSENLVMFLNKLHSVCFHDNDSSLLFSVERLGRIKTVSGIECRQVRIKVEQTGGDKTVFKNEIGGYQFTGRVHFSREEFESRYEDETERCGENGQSLPFVVIVPDEESIRQLKNSKGCLYSYLPTQIKINVPVAIHVPFKLDTSREYVDSQNSNMWFRKCRDAQRDLLFTAYKELAVLLDNSIIYLLPRNNDFYMSANVGYPIDFRVSRDALMALPIFHTREGYKKGNEIVCFSDNRVEEPQTAFDLAEIQGSLFCCPEDCNPEDYKLNVECEIYKKILVNAYKNPRMTKSALNYLEPKDEVLKKEDFNLAYQLTSEQLIEFSKYSKIFSLMQECAICCLKSEVGRPGFTVKLDEISVWHIDQRVSDFNESILSGGKLAKYFGTTGKYCLLIESHEPFFLPTKNMLCLSRDCTLDSYIDFVSKVEPNNIFYADAIIRREMEKIETYVNDSSISDIEYLNLLHDAQSRARRNMTEKGYAKYVENLLNTGISPTRCIKELLQNADDCKYPSDQIPSISIINRDNSFGFMYNEVGFTRENLKAITSIAGSTKEDDTSSVGHMGIGFKSVFCIAKRVQIHSGNFYFQLSKSMPTIPVVLDPETKPYNGTFIMFELENESMTREVLEELSVQNATSLILCLRKLKKFNILGSKIEIRDEDGYRNIFLNSEKKYVFWKHTKSFAVDKDIKKDKKMEDVQSIACYYQMSNISNNQVDDKPMKSYVYCGLPTEIETYNHMFIDANFDLITSRGDLKKNEWNNRLIDKTIDAVAEFLCKLVRPLRSDVFALLGQSSYSNSQRAVWSLFSNTYMQEQSHWLEKLKETEFLPTYDENSYIAPSDEDGVRYPVPATYLLRNKKIRLSTPSSKIIDAPQKKIIDGHEVRMENIYNTLDLSVQDSDVVLDEIEKYIETYITERPFRESLYSYLGEEADDKDRLKSLVIIPLRRANNNVETKYMALGDNTIYYLETASKPLKIDINKYLVLDTDIMSVKNFLDIFGKSAYPLNEKTLRDIYRTDLERRISGLVGCRNFAELYHLLVDEIESGRLRENDCDYVLDGLYGRHQLPLKNVAGNIVTKRLFFSFNEDGYFKGRVMNELSVSCDCVYLADYYVYSHLDEVTADDIVNYFVDVDPDFKLESTDIEDLMDEYFSSTRWTLIHELYRKGLIDFELIQKYSLETFVEDLLSNDMGPFPSDAVYDERTLRTHMDEEYPTYGNIESIELLRSVRQVERNGKYYDIDSHELRLDTLSRYRPDSFSGRNVGGDWCFCQCCGTPKKENFIEVVSIERKSDKYRPPMRMALCLVCAKKYEELRANSTWVSQFEECLMKANHKGDKPVTIEVGENGYKYTFTQMHLAEIQYILEHDKKDGKG